LSRIAPAHLSVYAGRKVLAPSFGVATCAIEWALLRINRVPADRVLKRSDHVARRLCDVNAFEPGISAFFLGRHFVMPEPVPGGGACPDLAGDYVVLSNPSGYFEVNVCLDSCSCNVISLKAAHTAYQSHWVGRGAYDDTPQSDKIETPGQHRMFLSVKRTEGVGSSANWPWSFYLYLCTGLKTDGSCQVDEVLNHGLFKQGSFPDGELPPFGVFSCQAVPWGPFTVH
jgi:hypothetical protein